MLIQVLSAEVVDQIAAGEVVERPSHMVKEIVENSLDAGATQVHIEFGKGGRFVRVADNGRGLASEDLSLALERFATSKISETADLWRLETFGFRGEALASIAAVSHLTMTSRRERDLQAHRLISEFGKRKALDPIGGSTGTSVLIERLFENTPARLKFLKSDAAEHSSIKNTLKALALSHPHAEFRLQENEKLIAYWPACQSLKERVEQVLEIKPLYEGYATRENVRARAIFADPHHVAKTSKNIWLFAQNRWVQDRSLQAAVMEAYRSLLMHGEYPIAAIFVETDPDSIDVNIHPTKSQVKFQTPSLAFRAVQASLRDALEQAPWLRGKNPPTTRNDHPAGRLYSVNGAASSQLRDAGPSSLSFQDQQLDRAEFAKKEFKWDPNSAVTEKESSLDSVDVGEDLTGPAHADVAKANSSAQASGDADRSYWSSLQVLGQTNQTYIVCQARDRVVFVDQHAAHERVAFERLMRAWRGGKIDIQDFLFPLAIDMSPDKIEALLSLSADIEKLGVFIEPLGPGTIGVKAAPLFIKDSILGSVLEQVASECVDQGGSYSLEKVIGDICATMACHSVVRAGQALSIEQMKSLLGEMDQFPLSSFCPHGRPVSVDYPFYKLEKDFGRIV